jgi:hypothetical protein
VGLPRHADPVLDEQPDRLLAVHQRHGVPRSPGRPPPCRRQAGRASGLKSLVVMMRPCSCVPRLPAPVARWELGRCSSTS